MQTWIWKSQPKKNYLPMHYEAPVVNLKHGDLCSTFTSWHNCLLALTPQLSFTMGKDKKVKIGVMGTKSKKAMKVVPPSNPSLTALQQLQELGKKANLNSGQTRHNYSGYVRWGQEWLAGHLSRDSNTCVPTGQHVSGPQFQKCIQQQAEWVHTSSTCFVHTLQVFPPKFEG
jgi:hypothetical protein